MSGAEQADNMLSTSVFYADSKSILAAGQLLLWDERFSVKHNALLIKVEIICYYLLNCRK